MTDKLLQNHSDEYDDDQSYPVEKDSCNVFIKYLPPELTDTGLFTLFAPFGEVESCKVMIDPVTGHSLGYGFCRYSNPEDANMAIRRMSGQKISSKTLLCKLSNTQSVNNLEPSDNLYIKPLLATTSTDELRALFEKFGNVRECKVIIDKNTGISRQIGFVRFSNKSEATQALKAMNGYTLQPGTEPIVVKYAETDRAKSSRRAKLLINQSAAAARQMANYFYQFQQQMSWAQAYASTNAQNQSASPVPYVVSDSFGNVTMAPSISQQPEEIISPPPSYVPPPISPSVGWESWNGGYTPIHKRKNPGQNLFVFHLPPSIDDQGLWRLFSPFGQLDSVKVISERDSGKSKGYGFVKYVEMESAVAAMAAMNGFPLEHKHLKVTFKQREGSFRGRKNRRRGDPRHDLLDVPANDQMASLSDEEYFTNIDENAQGFENSNSNSISDNTPPSELESSPPSSSAHQPSSTEVEASNLPTPTYPTYSSYPTYSAKVTNKYHSNDLPVKSSGIENIDTKLESLHIEKSPTPINGGITNSFENEKK